MFGLHWFHGITMDTQVSDIGWTYVFLGLCFLFIIVGIVDLIKHWNR